jgi:glycosyl transferase family 92
MPSERGRAYLAACTIYRDDADYLAEWIEFHLLAGVERFFLYDNASTDHHLDVLGPYLEEGIATRHEWPFPWLGHNGRPKALAAAFEHCAGTHRDDARRIAFLDVDEFLFSPTGAKLPEVLRDYDEFPGVVVSRAEFGPSGHETKPAGLVIESYLERRALRTDEQAAYKSIVDPAQVNLCLSAHSFTYRAGLPVDEERRPLDPLRHVTRKPVVWSRLRVHHYFTRSEEERRRKAALWGEAGSMRRVPTTPVAERRYMPDDTLAAHARAVHEALARRG